MSNPLHWGFLVNFLLIIVTLGGWLVVLFFAEAAHQAKYGGSARHRWLPCSCGRRPR